MHHVWTYTPTVIPVSTNIRSRIENLIVYGREVSIAKRWELVKSLIKSLTLVA